MTTDNPTSGGWVPSEAQVEAALIAFASSGHMTRTPEGMAAALIAAHDPIVAGLPTDEGERIALAIEADDTWFDPSDGLHHAEPFRAGVEAAQASAANIARSFATPAPETVACTCGHPKLAFPAQHATLCPRFAAGRGGEPAPETVDVAAAARLAETEPAWVDRHGDVWRRGDDGLMHTRETRPFPREYVERKWGPLAPARAAKWTAIEPDVAAAVAGERERIAQAWDDAAKAWAAAMERWYEPSSTERMYWPDVPNPYRTAPATEDGDR